MDPLHFPFIFFALISTPIIIFPIHIRSSDEQYLECNSFTCGEFDKIGFPFWETTGSSYCGLPGFDLECESNNLTITLDGKKYRILDMIGEKHRITVARVDIFENICPQQNGDFSLGDHFNSTENNLVADLRFNCRNSLLVASQYNCSSSDQRYSYVLSIYQNSESGYSYGAEDCPSSMVVPMLKSSAEDVSSGKLSADAALKKGFEIGWDDVDTRQCSDCVNSGGRCGYNASLDAFSCFCVDGVHQATCSALVNSGQGGINLSKKFVIVGSSVAGTAMVGMLVGMLVFLKCRKRRQAAKHHSYSVTRSITSCYSSRTGLETSEAYYGLPLFEYDELKEATNNFDPGKELGDGGFGTVFYGKLRDGRAVAVKRLYENNYKRTAQFMNEVEILARLHHPNLVHLYGCTSRQSYRLLLVYEYVPNGTVADHLHGDLAKPGSLPWLVRINIALETASALVYLHASDIVHRDVKTNNILLDENFKVKVADFGLSRLFPTNVTHVSTAPQGTPGYVDPEYHQCYQLTDKSDVYSFGVVLMELISSLPAVDIMRHRQEINLSTMAMNKIQSDALHELVDGHLGFESDSEIRRMIEGVAELGFRCLQHGKDMRPSMAEVLSTLQGLVKQGGKTDTVVRENDSPSDDVVLLKVGPLTLSPDSVMVKWASMNPTPNASA